MNKIIAIDQSTSATKAMLFDEKCELLKRVNVEHAQYYPQKGWVEHDAEEIYNNTIKGIKQLMEGENAQCSYSLAITNQRETVVVWNKNTGKPVYHAVVWQCMRGAAICEDLKAKGYSDMVQSKCGLLIDPYFSASGAKWILDNVDGARALAEKWRSDDGNDGLMVDMETDRRPCTCHRLYKCFENIFSISRHLTGMMNCSASSRFHAV